MYILTVENTETQKTTDVVRFSSWMDAEEFLRAYNKRFNDGRVKATIREVKEVQYVY